MIPKFQDFLYPFLYQFKNEDIKTKKDIQDALIKHFHLTEEDTSLRTRSGSTTQFNDRIGWCIQWLRRALFIEVKKKLEYQITQRGKDYLSTHSDLRQDDLLHYPEFAEFAGKPISTNEGKNKSTLILEQEDLTPTEQLEKAFDSIEIDLANDLLQKVMDQSAVFFEHLVVDLLVKMGYGGSFADNACVTKLSNDEGIDGIIYEDKLGLEKIYFQAKRWSNQVGRPTIQQFAGALVGQNATKGVFITTSDFSKEAHQYVSGLHQKIVLINGKELAKYMIEYNVGVSVKKSYVVKKIDSDYFEE
ncbi:MAG: restriction endonuclease [Paludibacteraceae bacterium]|nr:restriction endonuclease [Paludibacteraceae bacterium]